MMTAVDGLHGGLTGLGETLQVERIGPMHQAGSDSLLTAQTYFALIKKYWSSNYDQSKFRGQLNGLGDNYTRRKGSTHRDTADVMFTNAAMQIQMTAGVYLSSTARHIMEFGAAAGDF